MKDFSYYRNIICKAYNPQKETLTKDNYYALKKQIISGDKKSADELFRLTCFLEYDLVAHAFAQGVLSGDFQDALQDTFFVLKSLQKGCLQNSKKRNQNYFDTIHENVPFQTYTKSISSYVINFLKAKEKNEQSQVVSHQKSYEMNELLQNPENVAVTEMTRKNVIKIVSQSGIGSKILIAKMHSAWLYDRIIQGLSFVEIAKNYHVSKQAVQKSYEECVSEMKTNSTEAIKELLL